MFENGEFKPGLDAIQWHRLRRKIDSEMDSWESLEITEELGDVSWIDGYVKGNLQSLMRIRQFLNTPEESAESERVRREMFG